MQIIGGPGNDKFQERVGADVLTGGPGSDTFVFDATALADAQAAVPLFDRITDFDQGNTGVYSATEGDLIDTTALTSGTLAEFMRFADLIRVTANDTGAILQINLEPQFSNIGHGLFSGFFAASIHWVTIAQLDGLHMGDRVGTIVTIPSFGGPSVTVRSPFVEADFNGDFRSDILWRNESGLVALWGLNGPVKLSDQNVAAIDGAWHFQATGDFNGDGKSDILWRNDNGTTVLWEMNGAHKLLDVNLNTISTDWSIQGTGDFNGDGHADILWRRASDGQTVLWEMNGGQKLLDVNLSTVSTDWHIQGIGDFNGDGKSDILWRNDNGKTVLWEMSGAQKLLDANVGDISTAWHIQGIGDFNGDGKSDILWRNDDGRVVLWQMNGASHTGFDVTTIQNNWQIQDIGDFTGNGKSDIMWRRDDGATTLYEMNGAQMVLAFDFGVVPVDWSIQRHHFDIV